ncbi:GIY-YIG nuclease family protein [Panacibacter sp. DH6]|uniref:GIY-YIG nuclease family protein n=1 Tax=Panacibacter microcysteis TaxID=2793269 RepID=A0A931E9F3_9BACT|nr:exonuclease domain-containing protein [Panacibacter microcysteis]MBG9377603.1 GIY-YIG nuclease family protein [Panacibacter microcysteis]
MYAIVDIETTGSHPEGNGITEIAIVLYDGEQVEGRFSTLVNPGYPIPPYVVQLTGITNAMTAVAPPFTEVAERVYNLLNNRIFVAHNVNFDYSFIKYHLRVAGFEWTPRKLCTLKLSRKAFPGFVKYGLGHICRELDIRVENRHRAGGDADATAILFGKILQKGGEKMVREFLRKENREQILPPNLPAEQVNNLPYTPGVYYFHDAKDKVIYVGKAKMLKNRVISHFTGLSTGKRRQEFLLNIHRVTFQETPTEFTAFILESIEIKRLWPRHNQSQKHFEHKYGIYTFDDAKGYKRLAIDKKRSHFEPVLSFNQFTDAHRMLWKIVREHELHPGLCFLDKTRITDDHYPEKDAYNNKVSIAISNIQSQLNTYAILEPAVFGRENVCILVEKGTFYGMGTIPENTNFTDLGKLKTRITQYPENEAIRSLIRSYALRYPTKVYSMD